MRLLVRANAHRPLDGGGQEVAASPDTPRRELWSWQVRLLAAGDATSEAERPGSTRSTEPLAEGVTVEVTVDPVLVASAIAVLPVGMARSLERPADELVVLVAAGGPVLVEGRHRLRPHDAFVLEGNDPLRFTVEHADDTTLGGADEGIEARVAVVRLTAATGRTLSWVP